MLTQSINRRLSLGFGVQVLLAGAVGIGALFGIATRAAPVPGCYPT